MSQPEAELKVSAEETKSKLIIERHERDKEMNNNKLMVQELQKLVTDERLEKEKLSQEVANLKSKTILLEEKFSQRVDNLKSKIILLDKPKINKSKSKKAQISRQKEELERLGDILLETDPKTLEDKLNAIELWMDEREAKVEEEINELRKIQREEHERSSVIFDQKARDQT